MRSTEKLRAFESLEPKTPLSASPPPAVANSQQGGGNPPPTGVSPTAIYSVDGSGNNASNPTWGKAGGDLYRGIIAANYGDKISSMNGQTLPSGRLISNLLGTQTDDLFDSRNLSAFIYAWGQFIDHDLDLTPDGGTSVPISVPSGDPLFDPNGTGSQTLPFTRSQVDPLTGKSAGNPLNQITAVTSFLDGSMVYGSDATRASALRLFQGGLLKTSAGNMMPFNTSGLPNANNSPYPNADMFLGGDIRANENIELTALQTMFMREHNRQAAMLAKQHPNWNDEQLYQGARQIVIAEIQAITFNEYLPALLGQRAIAQYAGYNPSVNPGISPEYSEAAFRFGHSQLDDDVEFLNNNGTNFSFTYTLPGGIQVPINTAADIANDTTGMSLVDAFFDPYVIEQPGVEGAILKYLASDVSQAVDGQMVDSVRNILFGAPGSGAGGQDLFALDVQRGRDVGLPTYNAARVAYGLPAVTSFSQITSDPGVQAQLQAIYGTVDKVELFVGGIVEDHARVASVGPTFQAIIANQFQRVRDGDRLWYQNIFSGSQLRALQNTSLSDIIRANTNATNIQDNVFFFKVGISGTVSQGGFGGQMMRGIGGLTVNLLNASDGSVVATTTTDFRGSYSFNFSDGLELGQYKVQVTGTYGGQPITLFSRPVSITRGDQFFSGVDFVLGGRDPGGHGGPNGGGGWNGWQDNGPDANWS